MHEVEVKALPLELLASILTPERGAPGRGRGAGRRRSGTARSGTSTRRPTAVASPRCSRRCWPTGGGRRSRTDGSSSTASRSSSPSRSACTTCLHGDPGDGGPLGDAEHACYERVVGANVAEMLGLIDPATSCCSTTRRPPAWSTASARPRRPGRVALPRRARHAATTRPTRRGRSSGRTSSAPTPSCSRGGVRARLGGPDRVVIIPPSIDPFSAKNRELDPSDGRRDPGDRRTGRRRGRRTVPSTSNAATARRAPSGTTRA